ncbi:MAG: RNA 2',3'-cyclic phosphodiesterase [Epsilonproteobacteria bacterium]|nr:RNA 2',3'-cyclic phosphodiesterase [Campylobacterota bacterium]NPA57600.1 RNA 2',3'-cyclic phosphodiesterase [Campylobacterota bacterium]
MRLFLGSFVELSDYRKVREEFSFIEGKWVERSNLHLTLLFLGEVKVPQSIIYRLSSLSYPDLSIPIKGLGFFGSPPRVLFGKLDPTPLQPIHEEVCRLLDYEPDRPFRPHITLCRIKRIGNYSRFIDKVRSYRNRDLGELRLTIQLIESKLTPKGPIYTPLHTF